MSLPKPPEHCLRQMLHWRAKRFIWSALAFSTGATTMFYFGYVHPRHLAYEEFFKNYDPYVRAREICEYRPWMSRDDRRYLHSCPSELVKRWEEKGWKVANLDGSVPSDAASEDVAPESEAAVSE